MKIDTLLYSAGRWRVQSLFGILYEQHSDWLQRILFGIYIIVETHWQILLKTKEIDHDSFDALVEAEEGKRAQRKKGLEQIKSKIDAIFSENRVLDGWKSGSEAAGNSFDTRASEDSKRILRRVSWVHLPAKAATSSKGITRLVSVKATTSSKGITSLVSYFATNHVMNDACLFTCSLYSLD